jgi:hypothetical protein
MIALKGTEMPSRVRTIAPPALLCDVRHELALIEVAAGGLLWVVRALVHAVMRPLVRARRVERPATQCARRL